MSTDWKKIVMTVAPQLASLFGTPLAGMAVSAIAGALLGDKNATEAQVAAAVQNLAPGDLVKLREIQADLIKTLNDGGIKLEEIAATDRESARDRMAKMRDWTPTVLAVIIIGGWFSVQWLVFHHTVDPSVHDVAASAMSKLDDALLLVLYFFFGSSAGSHTKDATIAKIAEQP